MKSIVICLLLLQVYVCSAQIPIDIVESTIKVGGLSEENYYAGFAEGDQMIFSFEEVNGKDLKEIEIIALPSSSRFMDYKSQKIADKKFDIPAAGIYKFRFSNSAIGGRVCKIKIQRLPKDETTRNFNTTVYWKTRYDTVFTPVQERVLVKSDTSAISVIDQVAKVSSQNALNGNLNRSIVDFSLPENTIAWSYFIGVCKEGKAAYEQGKDKFFQEASGLAMAELGPMAALAVVGINTFSKGMGDDNVKYWFISDWESAQAFLANQPFLQYKQGDIITEAAQMKNPLSGKVFLGLFNDNVMDAIEVNVKVTAAQVKQVWELRTVNKIKVATSQVPYLKN